MLKKGFIVVAVFILTVTTVSAQNLKFTEFPIAVGSDSTFAGGADFDGTNYLVAMVGDTLGSSNVTAQLISQTGSLVGPRISVGRTSIPVPEGLPLVAFDGTNYLMVWSDAELSVYGQFISPSGNLVGSPFPIGIGVDPTDQPCLAFGDATYLVAWIRNNALYARLVDKSGNLVGTEILINNSARDPAIAFDGTNYLIAWVDEIQDTDISVSGQLVSNQGNLIGTNFLIDGSSYPSDNPISICFDGLRHMVVFHEEVVNEEWDLYARFVTTSGTVQERITITNEPGEQWLPSIAFDGTNYLVIWNDGLYYSKGRFFNTSGAPVDTAFTIFGPLEDKFPLLTGVGFGPTQYLVITTRVDSTLDNGDVYGMFIPSPPTGIEERDPYSAPTTFELMENYPNPFNAFTSIKFTLPVSAYIELTIYNTQGQLVRTLFKGGISAGTHFVTFDGKDETGKEVSNGIYFYQLKIMNGNQKTKRMLLLK